MTACLKRNEMRLKSTEEETESEVKRRVKLELTRKRHQEAYKVMHKYITENLATKAKAAPQ